MKKYKLIYADPPYSYRNVRTGGSLKSGSAQKYDVMTVSQICALPIRQIADANSVLFLWVTTPLLPDGFEIMKAFGFKYKTAVYWRKLMSLGMGFWFRGQVEVLLMGIRGKVKAFRCQEPNFIQKKCRGHSQKPIEAYELIESLGIEPKIELFARARRDGWKCWGLEVDSDINMEDYEMKKDPIKTLENLAKFLGNGGDQSIAEIKEELKGQGLDPDKTIKKVKEMIRTGFRTQKITLNQ